MSGVIAIAGGLLGLAGAIFAAIQMRKERPFTPGQALLGAGLTVAGTGLYIAFTQPELDPFAVAGAIAIGAVVGYGEASLTKLRVDPESGDTMSTATGAYLVVWGAAYALTAILGQAGGSTAHAFGVVLQLFAVSTALASNASLLVRRSRLLGPRPTASRPAAAPVAVTGNGATLALGGGGPVAVAEVAPKATPRPPVQRPSPFASRPPGTTGIAVAPSPAETVPIAATAQPSPPTACTTCGRGLPPGARFCAGCGSAQV